MYDAVDDPYTYENSTVLINRLDLRDRKELDDFEAEISTQRAAEPLPEGELDFEHFCAIHHHLFQDVYDWAGTVRTVRMAKDGNPFCFPERIEAQAKKLFNQLRDDNYLRTLSAKSFAAKGAHCLSELSVIHAFREGNGRTQLSFFATLAAESGHALDLEKLEPDAMLNAMIASFGGDETSLEELIGKLIR